MIDVVAGGGGALMMNITYLLVLADWPVMIQLPFLCTVPSSWHPLPLEEGGWEFVWTDKLPSPSYAPTLPTKKGGEKGSTYAP